MITNRADMDVLPDYVLVEYAPGQPPRVVAWADKELEVADEADRLLELNPDRSYWAGQMFYTLCTITADEPVAPIIRAKKGDRVRARYDLFYSELFGLDPEVDDFEDWVMVPKGTPGLVYDEVKNLVAVAFDNPDSAGAEIYVDSAVCVEVIA